MRSRFPLTSGLVPVLTTVAMLMGGLSVSAQTPTAKPATPAAPKAPAKPSPSTAKPATAKPSAPEVAKAPAPPPPEDLHFKTVYVNGDQKTETVTYIKGQRERFEFQDMVLLKQHDQKRTIQVMPAAKTYLVAPEGAPPAMPAMPSAPQAAPKTPGIVMVTTTIVDTGEKKQAFGQQARHVKMVIDKQPMAGACDTTRMRIETDAWYIDVPKTVASQTPEQAAPLSPGACADQVQATSNGDPKAVGFPIEYKTTMTGDDGKPITSSMQISAFELTTLDPAMFEIPQGLNAAMNVRDLGKALSDANEMKLGAADAAPPGAPAPKTPGVLRIGVPEFTNKTPQAVDTRALRARLIQDLTEAKLEAVPMAGAAPADLQKRAVDQGYDYLLLAEVSELKVSKPGGLGGIMKAAGGVAGARGGAAGAAAGAAGAAAAPKENTESSIAVKLLQADGKQKLATMTKGKDGSGFSLQSGLGLAKFAGTMYVGMFVGPQMFMRLNSMGISHLSGMGMLGDPYLLRYQMGGMSVMGGSGRGIDATANAAGFLIQQSMAMNQVTGLVGLPGAGPSYDESLGEAVQNAAKAVQKALQK